MDRIRELVGPARNRVPLDVEVLEHVDCGSYVREKISYAVADGERVPAYLCQPKAPGPRPAVFCHHQHAGRFHLGKSEVVGLRGDPDLAYAHELAERGYVAIAPDAIGFEERNWSGDGNVTWFELSTRLVQGRTLLADCLAEVSAALDVLEQHDVSSIGFIGHSYGGRVALWAPAFDERIRASASNCGCIPYRLSLTRDTGIQAEFVVPGFAEAYDVDDVVAAVTGCRFLVSGTTNDRWSRGAQDVADGARARGADVELATYDGGHVFTAPMRERAYAFLEEVLDA